MLSPDVERVIDFAIRLAHQMNHQYVTAEHLMIALVENSEGLILFKALNVDVDALKKELRIHLKDSIPRFSKIDEEITDSAQLIESQMPQVTLSFRRIVQRAVLQTQSSGKNQVEVGNILVSFFEEEESFALHFLQKNNITRFDIISLISHGRPQALLEGADSAESENPESTTQGTTSSNGPSLAQFVVNLNQKAKAGKIDPLIGREDIVNRMLQTLSRRTKNNPLLLGDPGVGKTAIVEGLALRLVEGNIPPSLKDAEIYTLDLGLLLAGTKFRGDFEERLKFVLSEIQKKPHAILYVDEIHTLIGAGGTQGGSLDASNLLKPLLSSGELSCIGSTTHKDYRQHFEKDRAMARRFQRIDVPEPSVEETIEILQGLKLVYEKFHGIQYSQSAIRAAAELSHKYLRDRHLPDKAIDLLDESGARVKLAQSKKTTISSAEIEETLSQMMKVPVQNISRDDKTQLKNLLRNLKFFIFGQDKAVEAVVQAVKYARAGLNPPQKPQGSFLFAGPTGVGKTELAKQLAQQLGIQFLRFDMSEYMEKHAVARLIGAPPGYVGYEEGGLLTEAIHKNSHAVLLLDEVEKAHPDLMNILLQVMDHGSLTDSNGRVADFRHVILIMTTNAGAREASRSDLGILPSTSESRFKEAIKTAFSPEFINRLDQVIHFDELSTEVIHQVAVKMIVELQNQLKEKKVELTVHEDVYAWLTERGYEKAYGARPMSRVITENLKKPLVDELLFGSLTKGGTARALVTDGKIQFKFEAKTSTKSKSTVKA